MCEQQGCCAVTLTSALPATTDTICPKEVSGRKIGDNSPFYWGYERERVCERQSYAMHDAMLGKS